MQGWLGSASQRSHLQVGTPRRRGVPLGLTALPRRWTTWTGSARCPQPGRGRAKLEAEYLGLVHKVRLKTWFPSNMLVGEE